jgi:hypothetical protein
VLDVLQGAALMSEPSNLSRIPQYAVGAEDDGRFAVVDQSNYPNVYPFPAVRYGTREEAQERADRYNAIKEGKL